MRREEIKSSCFTIISRCSLTFASISSFSRCVMAICCFRAANSSLYVVMARSRISNPFWSRVASSFIFCTSAVPAIDWLFDESSPCSLVTSSMLLPKSFFSSCTASYARRTCLGFNLLPCLEKLARLLSVAGALQKRASSCNSSLKLRKMSESTEPPVVCADPGAWGPLCNGVSVICACLSVGIVRLSALPASTDWAFRSAAISAGVRGSTPGIPLPADGDGWIWIPATTLPGARLPIANRAGATWRDDARSMRSLFLKNCAVCSELATLE
mmetsp:Transcript_62/g.135  ORF Transcript_62/g.135 Transcript_62/m.135 type:complete len:271 (-) Transcript_62:724-1536(-)